MKVLFCYFSANSITTRQEQFLSSLLFSFFLKCSPPCFSQNREMNMNNAPLGAVFHSMKKGFTLRKTKEMKMAYEMII